MKGLILAAGRGSRLAPHHDEATKCMVRLFGKPLVEYSLESAVSAGMDEIVLVVGLGAETIINHFGIDFQGVRIRYVIQDEPQGLVHAMHCARSALDGGDFMLLLADEILWAPRHKQMIGRFHDHQLSVICGVVKTEDKEQIQKTYAVIEDDRDRRIYRLIEKPRRPLNQVRGTGNCIFRAEILDYVALTPINQNRNEKELPDLIQCAVDDGHLVEAFDICDAYVNINTKDDIAIAESEYAIRGDGRLGARP